MLATHLAVHAWNAIGDGRPFTALPDDYQGKLLDVAKEVVAGRTADIAGLEEFEARAKQIFQNPPKSVKVGDVGYAEVVAKAAGMGHVPSVAESILQVPAFAESVYRAAARNTHPDAGGNGFQALEEAMRIVREAHKRRESK